MGFYRVEGDLGFSTVSVVAPFLVSQAYIIGSQR